MRPLPGPGQLWICQIRGTQVLSGTNNLTSINLYCACVMDRDQVSYCYLRSGVLSGTKALTSINLNCAKIWAWIGICKSLEVDNPKCEPFLAVHVSILFCAEQFNYANYSIHVCRAVTGFAGPWMWIMDDTKCKHFELLMRQSFSAQYNLIMPTAPVCRMVMGSVSPWMWMNDPKCRSFWAALVPINYANCACV